MAQELTIIDTTEVETSTGIQTVSGMADRLGELRATAARLEIKLAATKTAEHLRDTLDEAASLEATLVEVMAQGLAPEAGFTVTGESYTFRVGPMANRREVVDPAAIFGMMKHKDLVALATFKLGDLDKYLTPPQLEQVICKHQDGARSKKLEARK